MQFVLLLRGVTPVWNFEKSCMNIDTYVWCWPWQEENEKIVSASSSSPHFITDYWCLLYRNTEKICRQKKLLLRSRESLIHPAYLSRVYPTAIKPFSINYERKQTMKIYKKLLPKFDYQHFHRFPAGGCFRNLFHFQLWNHLSKFPRASTFFSPFISFRVNITVSKSKCGRWRLAACDLALIQFIDFEQIQGFYKSRLSANCSVEFRNFSV